MKILNFTKYLMRFLFLHILISYITIWYFDKYVFFNTEQKFEVYLKLVEDHSRFYSFIPLSWVTIDGLFIVLIALFLLILYTTKFYTYVNEFDFVYENKYFDDFLILYLMWNSFTFTSLYLFRITGLLRSTLILYSIVIPLILFIFRNSEIISNILGRSVSKENYISFNLDEFSNFKNLRITSYRNEILRITCKEKKLKDVVIEEVDKLNKVSNLNLVVIRLEKIKKLDPFLEDYLILLNKKVLLISDVELSFSKSFIYRMQNIENKYFYYFNNDIQYGAKYIIKRLLDIFLSLTILILLTPLFIIIYLLIYSQDSFPVIIKQSRVGLHGKKFYMFKFRTMYKDSHDKRSDLRKLNKKTGPLFKLDKDPRVIKKLSFLRKYSLDELPQIFNVLKGDMSLVGPRPLFEEDTEHFDKSYMRRLNVLPGMTGLLQINERNTSDFEIWYKYDIEYIENWSLYLDLKIILKTFTALKNKKNIGI